eukprot:766453-Rhodomonas_salina.2
MAGRRRVRGSGVSGSTHAQSQESVGRLMLEVPGQLSSSTNSRGVPGKASICTRLSRHVVLGSLYEGEESFSREPPPRPEYQASGRLRVCVECQSVCLEGSSAVLSRAVA